MTSRPAGFLVRTLSACFAFAVLLLATIPIHAGDSPRQITVDSNPNAVETNEGSQASNTGTYSLSSGDTFLRLSASVGDIVDNGGGLWSWTYTPPDDSGSSPVSVTVTLHVTDSGGNEQTVSQPFDLWVYNQPPSLDVTGAATSGDEGASISVNLGTFTDPGADSWTVTVDWGDGSSESVGFSGDPTTTGATIDATSHTYANNKAGDAAYTVTVTVADNTGDSHRLDFDIVVHNVAPVVDVSGVTVPSANEGESVSFPLGSFSDPGTSDTWSVTVDWGDMTAPDGPNGVTLGDMGSLPHTYAENGSYTVTVTVTDDDMGSHFQTYNVTVDNVAPVVDVSGVTVPSANEGESVSFPLGSFSDPGTSDTWSVTVDWGDMTAPDGPNGVTPGDMGSLPHTYADNGSYTVTVTVTDDDMGSHFQTYNVTVDNVAPVFTAAGNQKSDEGALEPKALSGFLLGSFTDPGPDAQWTVWIDWDDGSSGSFNTSDVGLNLYAPHTYADNGVYTVSVYVTDKDSGTSSTGTFQVTVDNVAPVVDVSGVTIPTASEGASILFPLGSFSDPGADAWSVSVNWGDMTTPDGPNAVAMPGDLGSLSHTYAQSGTYTITVTVTDDDSGSHSQNYDVTVDNEAPLVDVSGASSQSANEGQDYSFYFGTFTDPGADTFTVSIDWGDSTSTSSPSYSGDASSGYTIDSVNHTYADNGTYTIAVVVTDSDSSSYTNSFGISISNVDPQVDTSSVSGQTFNAGDNAAINLGSFLDPGDDSWTMIVDWGDGSVAETNAVSMTGSLGSLSHTYVKNGTETVTVTVIDDDGGTDSDTFDVTVSNVAPVVDVSAVPPQTADEGQSVSFDLGTFSDPGSNSWIGSVDWGDGSSENLSSLTSGGAISASHAYADNGTYTVTVYVEDDDAVGDNDTFSVTVNNVAPVLTIAGNQKADEGSDSAKAVVGFELGTFTDAGVNDADWTIDVAWGDGGTDTYTDLPGAPVYRPHTYADDGVYTVSVKVTDKDSGDSSTDTFQITVDNVAPVVAAAGNQSAIRYEETTFDIGSFVDPGYDTHTVTVYWGDGDTSSPDSYGDPVGGYSIDTVNHSYSGHGVHTVTVVVDDGLDSGTNTFQVNVTEPPTLAVEAPTGRNVYADDSSWLGTLITGATNDIIFTVRNTGEHNLTGISVTLTDDSGGEIELLTTPPTSLIPGAEASFTIRCIPSVSGYFAGALSISSNDPDYPNYRIGLEGEAVDETSDFLYVLASGTTTQAGPIPLPTVWRGVTVTTNQQVTIVYQLDNLAITNDAVNGGTMATGQGIASVMVQFGTQKPVFISRAEITNNLMFTVNTNTSPGSSDTLVAVAAGGTEDVILSINFPYDRFDQSTLIPPFGTTPEHINAAITDPSFIVLGLPNGGFKMPAVAASLGYLEFSYSPFFLQGQMAWASDSSGDFLDGSNWTSGRPPTSAEDAVFHDMGPDEIPYLVSVPTATTNIARSLQILGGAGQTFMLSDAAPGDARFAGGESYIFNASVQFVQEDDTMPQQFVFDDLTIGGGVLDAELSGFPGSLVYFQAPVAVGGTNGLKVLSGSTVLSITNSFFSSIRVASGGFLAMEHANVGGPVTSDGSLYSGSGLFGGAVTNNGTFGPGAELTPDYIDQALFFGGRGAYVQSASGTLVLDIEGPDRGIDYDTILGVPFFDGGPKAVLDGTIELYGFGCGCGGGGGSFSEGDEFVVMSGFSGGITGAFSTVNLPSNWSVEYRDTDVPTDGIVDSVVIVVGPPPPTQIGVLAPDGSNLPYDSDFDFGGTLVTGCTPITKTFAVTNLGAFELTIDDLYVDGPDSAYFFVSSALSTNVLAPGASATFSIEFHPDNVGDHYAYLVIESDDPAYDPFYVDFFGYGNGAEPAAANDSVSRIEGRSIKIPASTLLANDTDADSDELSIVAGSTVSANGVTVRFVGSWVYYDATASTTNITDTFSYTVTDGHDATAGATVTVTVNPPPVLPPGANMVSATPAGPENRDITVIFQGAPRRNYRVWAQSILGGSWTLLNSGSPVTSGNDGRYQIFDPNVLNHSTRYYRSEIVP